MDNIIVVSGVVKDYDLTRAVDGVDLVIRSGEWLSIMGRSGSGKSTLLNMVGGLDTVSEGSITVDGLNLANMSEKELAHYRRETVGFIFQEYYLISYLNAAENVMLAQYLHSMPDEQEAMEALEKVGLEHRTGHLPSQLSGGEQQRVCIARALINSPRILLADEPTGNLDSENSENVMKLLKKLHEEEGFTIITVTHDPIIAKWGERSIVLEDGKVIEEKRH